MSKTLMSKVALRPRYPGTAYTLAIQRRRDFSAAQNRPMLESARTLAPSGAPITSTAGISEPPSPATPQYVPLTALELFLAENPGLKPFLLAGPAKELAVTESAIAWCEICDHVFHLIHGQICVWRTSILGTLRSRMAQWSSVKDPSNSERCAENASLVDDKFNTRSSQDTFLTFDCPQSFGREFMPFFSVFGERFNENSGYEIDLEDLQMKAENEKVTGQICLHFTSHMRSNLLFFFQDSIKHPAP